MANDAINESQSLQKKDGHSPFKIFSNTEVQPNTKHWIPFGCPVYMLDSALQSGRGIHKKWEYCSKFGIYLGRFPNHGRNVALMLDRTTGLVSPQYHLTFDPRFYTVKKDEFYTHWKNKAGFLIDERKKRVINNKFMNTKDQC